MTKPDDIPQHIWDAAYEALHPAVKENYGTSPFAMVQHLGIAKAILSAVEQEREACARLAEIFPVRGATVDAVETAAREANAIADAIRSRKDLIDGQNLHD